MVSPRILASLLITLMAGVLAAQDPAPKLRTAVIQWIADTPALTYDVRYSGDDTTAMPTALKYLLKDLADSEGLYLTGEDKSKTIASQNRRITLEYAPAKSKAKGARVNKIELKELENGVDFVVSFGKKQKPDGDHLARLDGILQTFTRKYQKIAKGTATTVSHGDKATAGSWSFEVRVKAAAAEKK